MLIVTHSQCVCKHSLINFEWQWNLGKANGNQKRRNSAFKVHIVLNCQTNQFLEIGTGELGKCVLTSQIKWLIETFFPRLLYKPLKGQKKDLRHFCNGELHWIWTVSLTVSSGGKPELPNLFVFLIQNYTVPSLPIPTLWSWLNMKCVLAILASTLTVPTQTETDRIIGSRRWTINWGQTMANPTPFVRHNCVFKQ